MPEFSKNLGTISANGEISLLDNQYAEIPANVLNDFGASDFQITLKIKSVNGSNISGDPDRDHGALFIRSQQASHPLLGLVLLYGIMVKSI